VLQSLEEQLLAIAAGERDRELRRTAEAVRAGQAEVARAAQAAEQAESERVLGDLVDALRDLDDSQSLGDVLTRTARHAEAMAGRAELVMIDRRGSSPWEPPALSAGSEAGPLVREAADSGRAAMMTGRDGHAGLAVPLIVGGVVVAVVYADAAGKPDRFTAAWPEIVEILVRHASRCLEALTARKASLVGTVTNGDRSPLNGRS
jgi:hypothetical protein